MIIIMTYNNNKKKMNDDDYRRMWERKPFGQPACKAISYSYKFTS